MRPERRHLPAAQLGGKLLSPLADGLPGQSGMLGARFPVLHQTDRHQQRTFLAQQIVDRAVVEPLQIDPLENVLTQPFVLLPRESIRHPVGAIADRVHTLGCFRFQVAGFRFHVSSFLRFTLHEARFTPT